MRYEAQYTATRNGFDSKKTCTSATVIQMTYRYATVVVPMFRLDVCLQVGQDQYVVAQNTPLAALPDMVVFERVKQPQPRVGVQASKRG